MSSSQASAPVLSTQQVIRPISNFAGDFWGDRFLNYELENLEKQLVQENEVGKLKEEVRKMLLGSANDSFHQLKLIDDIQRLAVAYHFEREINEALENIYVAYLDHRLDDNFIDLNYVSLCFRLLRQQGINISSDMFNSFKDESGMFRESIATDVEGLLSLYEAAYLRVRGETVLDEALLFSTTHLEASLKHESSPLSNMVAKALHRPLRKSLARVNAIDFIVVYKDRPSYSETLLKFSILDFNLLQSMHKKELYDLRKWWRDLELGKRLPFARDRIVECFFCMTGISFEPEFCLVRRILTKISYLITIIDDVYNSYGSFEEISLFTLAMKSWSLKSANNLPEYMKICLQAMLDCFEEMEESMIKQRTFYRMLYAKEAMNKYIQSIFDEAKWCNDNYIPTIEEYLSVSMTSCGYALLSTMCFVGMAPDAVTEENFQWLLNQPKILKSTEVIFRLMDDTVSSEREKEMGSVAKAIECYTTQHGTTDERAVHVLQSWVSEAWKDLNQELLIPTTTRRNILSHFLYMAQVTDEVYTGEDNYTVDRKFHERTNFCHVYQSALSLKFVLGNYMSYSIFHHFMSHVQLFILDQIKFLSSDSVILSFKMDATFDNNIGN